MNIKLKKKLDNIEVYQIVGSLIGILITFYAFFSSERGSFRENIVLIVITVLFFGMNAYSGYLLHKNKFLKGINLTLFCLSLQLLAFNFLGFYYSLINGIALNFTLDYTSDFIIGFDFLFSQCLFANRNDTSPVIFKANIIAILLLFYVFGVLKEIKNQESKI